MSLKTVKGLPSIDQLKEEGIQVLFEDTDLKPLRPLSVVIVNLMPAKEVTERQLLRLIGNTPWPVDIEFVYMKSYKSKHISQDYLEKYYKSFDDIKNQRYDGLIVTGAPVEHLSFDGVAYFKELKKLIEWSDSHTSKRLFICWGAQFALNQSYGIRKHPLPKKLFGIYEYQVLESGASVLRGFDDTYKVPVSRHTQIDEEAVSRTEELEVLTAHPKYGPDILATKDEKDLFVLGHLEYDRETLGKEYLRDIGRGKEIEVPENYYPNDDPEEVPDLNWRSHAYLLYTNWVNELSKVSRHSDGWLTAGSFS